MFIISLCVLRNVFFFRNPQAKKYNTFRVLGKFLEWQSEFPKKSYFPSIFKRETTGVAMSVYCRIACGFESGLETVFS